MANAAARSADGLASVHVHHVNLQPFVGGGEVYVHALTRALLEADATVTLYVHPQNRFWDDLPVRRVLVEDAESLEPALPADRSLLFVHTRVPEDMAKRLAARHALVGFSHNPMFEREPGWLRHCPHVVTVSRYCMELLAKAGVENVYPAPVYGVAEARRGDSRVALLRSSPYWWDERKARDVLLGKLEPLANVFSRQAFYEKRRGLTLGVVSMIAPIKQFPLLFRHLAPILARHEVNLEVFGAGGYAQVRDTKAALAPLGERARWWGHQKDVAAAYAGIDYLLTGLPEKEALGINVLEAQACGTPVLAPKAPPFTETVLDGHTGFLYADPRTDGGADFGRLLERLKKGPRPDPRRAVIHLSQFSQHALFERTRRLLDYLTRRASPPPR
jgi:glycosyltransferase involved in cell wall biosynthesis